MISQLQWFIIFQ